MFLRNVGLVLVVLVMLSVPALAQSNIGLQSVGGRLFYTDFSGSSAIGVGGVVGLGEIAPQISLEGNVDYWSKSFGSGDFSSSLRDIAIGGTVKYLFSTKDAQIKPFVNGGLALHLLNSKTETPSGSIGGINYGGSYSNTDTKIGIDIGGGAAYAMSPTLDLVGAAMYRLVSNTNQLFLSVGALVHLNK